jgi:hypothetical protein
MPILASSTTMTLHQEDKKYDVYSMLDQIDSSYVLNKQMIIDNS